MAAEQTVDEKDEGTNLTEAKGRATPSRRKSKEKNEESGNALTRPFVAFADYLSNVRSELNKVTWPTREDTIRLTRIVIAVTIIAALALGLLSALLTQFMEIGLQPNNSWILLAVIVAAFGAAIYWLRRS